MYVDHYSGWNKTAWFPPGKSNSVELIRVLREEFAEFGVPEELSCDRGTSLAFYKMKEWFKSWE